jgi:hypothetical protein
LNGMQVNNQPQVIIKLECLNYRMSITSTPG